ncbi:C1 family peptidase [Methanobrevibacter sp.]|uniref:C1 family peptidase n=1 Tax=Methanobrevibacter sp. TaxID=66852 RepID=UPI00388FE37F
MKRFKLLFILLFLFISVSAVYADGNFTSLQTEINDAGNTIEITQDYIYDNSTDYQLNEGIIVNKTGFTINGNGHTIDAKGQARIFNVIGDININNLTLINGFSKDAGGAIFTNDRINFNNVTFENNSAKDGGAVKIELIEAENCVFNNNHAEKGGAISFSFQSFIANSVFKNSFNLTYSLIYGNGDNSGIGIINCTFLNSTSKYATALYAKKNTAVINSTFVNLHSTESAGAIFLYDVIYSRIINSTFINVTAVKNAGSIFIDSFDDMRIESNTLISNTTFINSSANFGGALLYLGRILTIKNSKFINNTASLDGGAIYASNVEANIYNTSIISNKLINEENNGGGMFFDNSDLNITDSNFFNNTKNAIYAYDCNLTVNKSTFKNNGEAIHGVFLNYEMNEINLNNDTLFLTETDFFNKVSKNPINLILINNTINVTDLPKRFDSREWGWISSVKNQILDGSCWTFGTLAALESALLKSTGIEYDFSENNIKDTMLCYSKYGDLKLVGSGYVVQATQNILSWLGPVFEENDTYDVMAKVSPIFFTGDNIHIQDAIFVGPRKNLTDNDEIKKAIMDYGSLAIEYYSAAEAPDYNNKTHAQYQDLLNLRSHAVSVVGWDDNFPKENFLTTPPGDGAWILKDSFGLENGDGGFIYLSYYDISFLNSSYAVGFIIENTENYVRNYQTDLSGEMIFFDDMFGKDLAYKTTYESQNNELISGIGTYFKYDGEPYALNIYVNNELKHMQNGTGPYYGFHTIKLTNEIPIKPGDNFTVEITKKSIPIFNESRQHNTKNTVFMKTDDVWRDLALQNRTVSLKVYTKDLAIYTEDLVKIYKNDSKFEANVGAANENVIFEINGANYTRVSDENGTARMAINLNPGNYTIKTTFNGTSVENSIEVLPTLIAQNLVKYFRNESQFYISLIDGMGNAVSNATITMNINGVFYNRTTNENGTAKLNINLNPGEYILTASDPLTGLMMSYNITVLSVLTADDINMTYKDGTQFMAKLVDGKGNPLENAGVTFNINGIFYTRYTDSNGTAKLNINLMPGEYIITSQYESAVISNKITISAKED